MKHLPKLSLLFLAALPLSGCPDSHGTSDEDAGRDAATGADAAVLDSAVGSDAGGRVLCGATLCELGDVCCNESCGICAAPDEGCITLACEPACEAQDARGEGGCEAELGVVWRDGYCSSISGCTCVGDDCGSLYDSVETCLSAHRECERICGGFFPGGTADCLADEFCDYPDGSFCGGDDSGGVCTRRPTDCLLPGGVPVCGCDCIDYENDCLAHLNGSDVAEFGPCRCGG